MAELRRPALRLALGLALVAALLVEVHTLMQSLGAHQRQQARASESLREALLAGRAPVAERLLPGGPAAWEQALEFSAATVRGASAELFDLAGRRLASRGEPVRVAHWVDVGSLRASGPLGVFVVGPFQDEQPQFLAYQIFDSGGERVVLRVAQRADDLRRDVEERRGVLFAHALSLALVLVVALVALLGPRQAAAGTSSPRGALVAYETAMGHLREREQRLSEEHAAERQRLEQAMREREALARAGELTAGLAHEVRNGLGTILGYARLIERSGAPPETLAAAAAVREECETLASVVRRFVEYVRAEELKPTRFDPRRTLARVAARETRGHAGAPVELLNGPALDLCGDEELLERAFENVVRNAREAAGPGGRVEIEARADTGWIEISVRDDGPGLGPQGAGGLRPFRSSKPGGLGLGLPLSSKLVWLHGGELRLGARVPRGLEVLLRLPREGADSAPDVTNRNATDAGESSPTLGGNA